MIFVRILDGNYILRVQGSFLEENIFFLEKNTE